MYYKFNQNLGFRKNNGNKKEVEIIEITKLVR